MARPRALWGTAPDVRVPALVRIDGDDFMDRFGHILAHETTAAAALWAARPGAADDAKLPVLYQAVHGSYALVCASLTCKAAGRPEKAVAPARGESVGFVLRRVGDAGEEGWFPAGSGEGAWKPAAGAVLADGEELIPMFPVPAAGAPRRRIWAGLVPTSSRETYRPAAPGKDDPPTKDGRLIELEGVWAALTAPKVEVPIGPRHDEIQKTADEAALQAVLALAEFLSNYILPPNGFAKDDIAGLLTAPGLGAALTGAGLAGVMKVAWGRKDELLGTMERKAGYPGTTNGFALPLIDPKLTTVRDAVTAAVNELVERKVPSSVPNDTPNPKFDLPFDRKKPPQRYAIRCAYVRDNRPGDPRAKCPPPVVGPPSAPFAIAPVHDPAAPARTIRIPMPLDVSIGGLRALKKNVGFVLSKELNAKVQAFSGKKLKDIDDGNVSDGTGGDGEICTFALPIITLCAMIVLYIFLALLNIVFFWMPLVKICLPLPKGKSP